MTIPECPFSDKDVDAIIKNMLKNIASPSNSLTLFDKNTTILAAAGAIIASPAMPDNKFSQSYFFHWVRDGAIIMLSICNLYEDCTDPERKADYKEIILNYLDFVEKIQSQPQLNGFNVLGEPKFNIDGTLWTGAWGRPQSGGAACQALVLAKILSIFIKEEDSKDIIKKIYNHDSSSLLKANLEYCAKVWSNTSFSMWEELDGNHFSVSFLQHLALLVGSLVAIRLLDPKASFYYREMASHINNVIKQHWNEDLGYYFETLNKENFLGGGIDSSILIGLSSAQSCPTIDKEYLLTSERPLSTIFYIRNAFENLYKINVDRKMQGKKGVLIGRYVQDIYDGNQSLYGNPWFICSAILASSYYQIAEQLLSGKEIKVSFLVKQFLLQTTTADFSIDETINKHHRSFSSLINSLLEEGDAILDLLKEHSVTYPDGSTMHMSEQIDRSSGMQVSARDLSWSYAAVLHAIHERKKLINYLTK